MCDTVEKTVLIAVCINKIRGIPRCFLAVNRLSDKARVMRLLLKRQGFPGNKFWRKNKCLKMQKPFQWEFAGRPLVVETGKLAQLASGECMIRYGETAVHCVATISDKPVRASTSSPFRWIMKRSFTPWAESPAPSFAARAVPPRRQFCLPAFIDRPMRPLFPKDMRNDVSIVTTVMSVDPDCPPRPSR